MFIISALVLFCFFILLPGLTQSVKVQNWRKGLRLAEHQRAFQNLFSGIDGFYLSKLAREKADAVEYVYGEIEFESFVALLSLTHPNQNTVFYDLGSGVGKAVLTCAMVFDVKKSCGIELFEPLHHAALEQKKRLQQLDSYAQKSNIISLVQDNFLNVDFADATLVFINSTAFFGDTWEALNHRLAQLNPETIIITTSKKLHLPQFIVLKTTTVQMSWGIVDAYVQTQCYAQLN